MFSFHKETRGHKLYWESAKLEQFTYFEEQF